MPIAVGFTHPREAPRRLELSRKDPGDGEARVCVEACGLGVADFGFFQLDALPRTPLVPGLEAVGVVDAVGAGVSLLPGTRVGLTPLASSCGGCDLCERGLERYCAGVSLHGWHRDGFLSTEACVVAGQAVPLPADADPVAMAPLFASGWTAFSAVRATGVGEGHRVGVIGVGGLGLLVVQVARALGLQVQVSELDPARLAASVTLGAQAGLAPESVDAVIVCTPSAQAIHQASRAVRRGGVLVLAAASPSVRFDLSLFDLLLRGVTVRSAFLGSRSELTDLLALAAQGSVRALTTPLALDEVPEKFWVLRDGGVVGRVVVTPRNAGRDEEPPLTR